MVEPIQSGNGYGDERQLGEAVAVPQAPLFNDAQWRALSVILDRQLFMRMAGTQFDGRRDLYTIFGYDRTITARQFREEYARGGIAKRIVEAFPLATWRGGVEVYEDEKPDVETEFEKAWKDVERKYSIWSTLQDVDILAGLSTYSVLLIGAPGKLDEELPQGKPGGVLYFQPYWGGGGPGDMTSKTAMRTQASDTDVQIEAFDRDTQSPRFGDPEFYRIRQTDRSGPMLDTKVHWSRMIHVAEGALDTRVYGAPRLEAVWNYLMDLEKITGGGSESFFQRAKHITNLNMDKDMTLSPDQLAELKTKLDEFQHNVTTMLPTRGVDVKLLEAAVANFANQVDAIVTLIAGTTGIPKRILTGSEMGELASTQDAANFDSQVQDRRTGYAGPKIVRRLVDRLIEYGYLPKPKQYEVGWPLTENMDDKGKAQVALLMAQVNQTQGDPVFTENEMRERSFDYQPMEKDIPSSDKLSEGQKADVAFKLAQTNKAMGVTVYTDDEIRKMAHGFEPLTDSEKVPIGAPERISVATPPELGADGKAIPQSGQPMPPAPMTPAARLKAAEDRRLLRVLEVAIRKGDQQTVSKILGLQEHKYGTTQVQLPPDVAAKLIAFGQSIPDSEIVEDAGGRETDAHVTVRYGLTAPDADLLSRIPLHLGGGRPTTLGKAQALSLTLGKASFFSAEDYDVVYIDVKSEDLVAVNRAIGKNLPVAPNTYPSYSPHATVAYVKPGSGQNYAGWAGLDGVTVIVKSIVLSDADGNRTEVPFV